MILFTLIGKISNAIILASDAVGTQDDSDKLLSYRERAKELLKKMRDGSLAHKEASIESDKYFFHYRVSEDVLFLCLCERSDSKIMAFKYLTDLESEFNLDFKKEAIASAQRPFAFLTFEKKIEAIKRQTRASKESLEKIEQLREEVNSVAQIVTINIRDVLQRGELVGELEERSAQLASSALQFKNTSADVYLKMMIRKHAPLVIIVFVVCLLIFLRYKVFS